MNKIFLTLLFFSIAVYAQPERVAILQTIDNLDSISADDLKYLTSRLREIAGNNLPKNRFSIMTEETIIAKAGSQEMAKKICEEASCDVDIGKKISADYIMQPRISRFGGGLTISVPFYNTSSGSLISSFSLESKDIGTLISDLSNKAPAMFKEMANIEDEMKKAALEQKERDIEFKRKEAELKAKEAEIERGKTEIQEPITPSYSSPPPTYVAPSYSTPPPKNTVREEPGGVRWGLIGGWALLPSFGFSSDANNAVAIDNSYGSFVWQAGITLNRQIVNEKMAISIDALWSSYSSKFRGGDLDLDITAIDIPIMFRYKFIAGLYATAGLKIGIPMYVDLSSGYDNINDSDPSTVIPEISLAFGAGYEFEHLFFQARYFLPMTNVAVLKYKGTEISNDGRFKDIDIDIEVDRGGLFLELGLLF